MGRSNSRGYYKQKTFLRRKKEKKEKRNRILSTRRILLGGLKLEKDYSSATILGRGTVGPKLQELHSPSNSSYMHQNESSIRYTSD